MTLNAGSVAEDGGIKFKEGRDGKILLARVRGYHSRKRARKDSEGNVVAAVGERIYEDITLDGNKYAMLYSMEGGILDMADEYFNRTDEKRTRSTARVLALGADDVEEMKTRMEKAAAPSSRPVRGVTRVIQHDGAPGHGLNNRNGGTPSVTLQHLTRYCRRRGYDLIKQPRNSPCINLWDLVVFRALKSAVERRHADVPVFNGSNQNAVQAALWEIVKEEWNKLDPKKLFNISVQRRVIIEKMVEVDGGEVREVHANIRKTFNTGTSETQSLELEEDEDE